MKKVITYILAAIGAFTVFFVFVIGYAVWARFNMPEAKKVEPENIVLDIYLNYPIVEG